MAFMKLSEKIPILVKRKGVTQSELAKVLGVDPSRVSEWVNERGNPSLSQAFRMARFLDVSLDYLADDAKDKPPEPSEEFWRLKVLDVVNELGLQLAYRRLLGIPADHKDANWAVGVDAGGDMPDASKRGA